MENKIKYIVSDLDGTLLNDHKVVSDESARILIELQEKGYKVVLASGRYEKEVRNHAQKVGLFKYGGYMVCGNGYEVIDVSTGIHDTFDKIEKEETIRMIELAKKMHIYQYVKVKGAYHLSISGFQKAGLNSIYKMFKGLEKLGYKNSTYMTHLISESVLEKDLVPFIEEDVVKVAFIGLPGMLHKLEAIIREDERYAIYYVNPCSFEVTSRNVSKKNAVRKLVERNGDSLDNVIAFGDSGNDEPLLKSARIGITMKNGTKRALKAARIVSEYTNHEDGVVKECLKYLK